MLNKVFLMGRLTQYPELRHTNSGIPFTRFSLAVDRDYKAKSDEKETDFFNVIAWRSTAEFVAKYFAKGRMAVVEGRLQTTSWQDKDGNKRRSLDVVADNVYFGDSKRDKDISADSPPAAGGHRYAPPSGSMNDFAEIDDDEGDLPF